MPLDPVARAALLLERPELLEASLARIYHHFKNTPMGINITVVWGKITNSDMPCIWEAVVGGKGLKVCPQK